MSDKIEWEYTVTRGLADCFGNLERENERANRLGAKGWELVSAVPVDRCGSECVLWYKRKKEPGP